MDFFVTILEGIVFGINILAVATLLWGLLICTVNHLRGSHKINKKESFLVNIIVYRNSLGIYILLALEILIIADIIETITDVSLENLLKLFGIVIIRTIISYFLSKEEMITTQEIKEHLTETVDEDQGE